MLMLIPKYDRQVLPIPENREIEKQMEKSVKKNFKESREYSSMIPDR